MKRVLLLSLLLLVAAPAAAQNATFIYSKTVLKIVPKAESEPAAPVQTTPKTGKKDAGDASILLPDAMMPKLKRTPKEFTVEVRPLSFLDQRDFISHQPFADREGMLILVTPPAEVQVHATRMLASADVLFVNEDGVIFKIAPSLNLTGLTEPVDSDKPVHALVYLKAGTCAASDIEIDDRIENQAFKTHPTVLQ